MIYRNKDLIYCAADKHIFRNIHLKINLLHIMHQVYCKTKQMELKQLVTYLIMPRSMEMITTIEIIFKLLRVLVAFLLSLTTGSIT